jgi:Cu-Zn family superoxide dismutase
MIAKRTASAVALLLAVTASLASGAVRRHVAWDGMVLGVGGSKIRGDVEMVAGKVSGTTAIEVTYARDAAGAVRPWHVHVGSCAKGGPVLGSASAYPVLKVDAKGAAEGKATLRLALPESGSYYVNIHESAAAMSKVVACGDLLLEE